MPTYTYAKFVAEFKQDTYKNYWSRFLQGDCQTNGIKVWQM